MTIKGQLLSVDGSGCFFKVEKRVDGFHVEIYSHFDGGHMKQYLNSYNEAEIVDSVVVQSEKEVLEWLDNHSDY